MWSRVAAQVAVIALRSFLQPVFGGVGITMIALGTKLRRETRVTMAGVSFSADLDVADAQA